MLGVGAGIVVVMMALVSWNSKYHRSFHVDVNENRNWNILMFLCQPIFLNLRHVFEDFLLTALIKKSEYDSKLTKYNILWNIQFLFRKRRGLFSELAYQYFCQICSNDHTSELRNSSTFHNHCAVLKKITLITPGSDHCLSLIIHSFTPVVETVMMWLWLRGRDQPNLK